MSKMTSEEFRDRVNQLWMESANLLHQGKLEEAIKKNDEAERFWDEYHEGRR